MDTIYLQMNDVRGCKFAPEVNCAHEHGYSFNCNKMELHETMDTESN